MSQLTINRSVLCGIDLGGTKIAVALVTPDGMLKDKRLIHGHRGTSPRSMVQEIAATTQSLLSANGLTTGELDGVGVGTSGHVDYRRRVVITNSNLPGFVGLPLGEWLEELLQVPVYLDNDANAQAYAEYRFGAGRGFPEMAFVTLSTGVGAGMISGGTVFRGVTGTAGELGHTIVEPSGTIRCGCGRTGCLMAYTSGLTLPRVVREMLTQETVPRSEIAFSSLDDGEITGELIGSGLAAGDPFCRAVVERNADYVAIGLNNLYQVMNPGLFVLGGGLTAWGPVYIDRIRERFRELVHTMAPVIPEIRTAGLGTDAAVIGAASLPLEHI